MKLNRVEHKHLKSIKINLRLLLTDNSYIEDLAIIHGNKKLAIHALVLHAQGVRNIDGIIDTDLNNP